MAIPEADVVSAEEAVVVDEVIEATPTAPAPKLQPIAPIELLEELIDDEYEDDDSPRAIEEKRKKEKQKRRQLVYDEDTGQTFAKRRRKGGRKSGSWDGEDF